MKIGEEWDGDSALTNQNAKYNDGKYYLDVLAYDIEGNGGDTINWRGAIRDTIILDNFAPAYSSNYSLFNTFIFDTTTNQEYLLGSYNINQYDEFRVYDNMKLNLILGPTESILGPPLHFNNFFQINTKKYFTLFVT